MINSSRSSDSPYFKIRLYGDPSDMGRDKPDLQFSINVKIEERRYEVVRDKSIDVICDFVGGYAFGDCIGLVFRSIDGWWSVQKLVPARGLPLVSLYSCVPPFEKPLTLLPTRGCFPIDSIANQNWSVTKATPSDLFDTNRSILRGNSQIRYSTDCNQWKG